MSNIGRENVTNSLFEYQSDTLAAAAANAQLEGDDVASFDAVSATVRMQNYAQISRKTIILSATEEVVNKAGRRSELAYQIAKRGAEIKRDQSKSVVVGKTGRGDGRLGAHVNKRKEANYHQEQWAKQGFDELHFAEFIKMTGCRLEGRWLKKCQ